jgi:hypothetical protein
MQDDWQGDERRAIPIHILNHIDSRLAEHVDTVNASLSAIQTSIDENGKASKVRHQVLVDQITVVAGKYDLMEQAFLKTEEGNPDFHGHHDYHYTRKDFARWVKAVKQNMLMKLFEYVGVGFFLWISYLAWEGFLRGPVK